MTDPAFDPYPCLRRQRCHRSRCAESYRRQPMRLGSIDAERAGSGHSVFEYDTPPQHRSCAGNLRRYDIPMAMFTAPDGSIQTRCRMKGVDGTGGVDHVRIVVPGIAVLPDSKTATVRRRAWKHHHQALRQGMLRSVIACGPRWSRQAIDRKRSKPSVRTPSSPPQVSARRPHGAAGQSAQVEQ